jgi:hypothetical protein
MNKKLFYIILASGLVIVVLGLIRMNNHSITSIIYSNQSSPINQSITTVPENLAKDPFGAPPKGTSPNCGPEDRYKFNVTINSKEDFINFLKNNIINQSVELDNFKDRPEGSVNWDKVLTSLKTERIDGKTIYVLNYNPATCSGFTLKMTIDGYVSVYGCCGK